MGKTIMEYDYWNLLTKPYLKLFFFSFSYDSVLVSFIIQINRTVFHSKTSQRELVKSKKKKFQFWIFFFFNGEKCRLANIIICSSDRRDSENFYF